LVFSGAATAGSLGLAEAVPVFKVDCVFMVA